MHLLCKRDYTFSGTQKLQLKLQLHWHCF